MVEAYAFLAAFLLQILATSVLYPAWFVRYVRARTTGLPAERLAQLYPGVDVHGAQERFLTQYRALLAGIALLGLLLLAWFFSYVQRPDWVDGPVEVLATAHFFAAQVLPLGLLAWLGVRFNKEHRRSLPEGKRKAVLQRRGLFDFVSPFAVCLAGLSYLLFVAFVIYLRQHAFPGLAAFVTIVGVTLVYALVAVVAYTMLYGRNKNPLDTHADRLRSIGVAVKSGVYTCIAVVVYLSLNLALRVLDLERWEPFGLSAFYFVCALLASAGVMRRPADAADGNHSLAGT